MNDHGIEYFHQSTPPSNTHIHGRVTDLGHTAERQVPDRYQNTFNLKPANRFESFSDEEKLN
jgi:hypothetical protein